MTLLVAFVALAIVDIQNHRSSDPRMIGLAAVGFAAYALLAGLGWKLARGFEGKIAKVVLVCLYFTAMAALFLIATVIFLLIEYTVNGGRL